MSVELKKFAYSIAEAADSLGVSVDTVQREIKDGRLPQVYSRGKRVIPAKALERYVDELPAEPRRSA